jgi:hypothetical protein
MPVAATAVRSASRGPVFAILVLAITWCLVLAGLVLTAANPIVVNPVQILHADIVAQGQWISGEMPEIDAQTMWKGELAEGRHPVGGMLPEQRIRNDVIAPLTRLRDGRLIVTGGKLANPPRDPHSGVIPVPSTIRPVVYPATDDVLRQLRELLGEPRKASAP